VRGVHESTDACTGHCRPVRVVVVYDHGNEEALPWVVSASVLDRLLPTSPKEPTPDPVTPDHPEVKEAERRGRELLEHLRGGS
jgi:hypothetical protein